MAAKKDKIEEVRQIMATSGLWLVGAQIWPYDKFHLMTVASTKSGLDPVKLANQIYDITGIICAPFPQKPSTPNVYNFLAYGEDPGPDGDVRISDVEFELRGIGVVLVAVSVKPVAVDADTAEAIVGSAEDFAAVFWSAFKGDEVPAFFDDNVAVPAHTWVFLGVRPPVGKPPLDTGTVKALLENQGFKVIAPDKGISGFFEDTETYVTSDGTYVLFNAGSHTDVTAAGLKAGVFAPLGDYYTAFFTTPELISGQSSMDLFYGFQGAEGGVGSVGDEALQLINELLAMLQTIMKSLPVIVWVAIGGVVVFLGWNIYKYISEERSRPSVYRRSERKAYEERY